MPETTTTNDKPQQFLGGVAISLGTRALDKFLDRALNKAMDKVEKRPDIPVGMDDKAPIKEAVRKEVVKELGPAIENITNQEPLWRSKVLWTAFGTLIASIGGMLDMYFDGGPDSFSAYYALMATAATSIGTIYSRIWPTKAIGR